MSVEYFDKEAERYDKVVRFTQEDYDDAHACLAHCAVQLLGDAKAAAVLDLGCGTGEEACRILAQADRPDIDLTLLDGSRPMLEHARRRLVARHADGKFTTRLVVGDLRQPEAMLKALQGEKDQPPHFDLVISAFTLHHIGETEKLELYQVIAKCLRPGGYFVNLDLFTHFDHHMQEIARRRSIDWLDVENRKDWDEHDVRRWRAHITQENRPLPIQGRPRTASETSLLVSAEFRHISVPYRFFETGIMVAQKP